MIETYNQPKLAVLIDADNVIPTFAETLFTEIAKLGDAIVRRAYGDWTTSNLGRWKSVLPEYSIRPIQQFRNTSGKNATDITLVIDAMDLLYTKNFDGFCLVSSDSDFTGLASRIREDGKLVYGFGEKKSPRSLVAICTKFIYLENFTNHPQNFKISDPNDDHELVNAIKNIVEQYADDGWANTATLGRFVNQRFPDFDPKNYGCKKFKDVWKQLKDFQVEVRTLPTGNQAPMIRLK